MHRIKRSDIAKAHVHQNRKVEDDACAFFYVNCTKLTGFQCGRKGNSQKRKISVLSEWYL